MPCNHSLVPATSPQTAQARELFKSSLAWSSPERRAQCLGDVHPRVLLAHEVDVADGQVLAHDVPPVVALGVVPRQTVVEEVIEECGAGLKRWR